MLFFLGFLSWCISHSCAFDYSSSAYLFFTALRFATYPLFFFHRHCFCRLSLILSSAKHLIFRVFRRHLLCSAAIVLLLYHYTASYDPIQYSVP